MNPLLIRSRRGRGGFTLVELLTVIAIIAILAAMLLPVLSRVRLSALKTQARIQVNDIATAIEAYDSAYGRFPVSPAAQAAAAANAAVNGDFTYGGTFFSSLNPVPVPVQIGTPIVAGGPPLTNSEVIEILMDYTNYPSAPLQPTVNNNAQKNPQQTRFLNAKMSGWDTSMPTAPLPGVGNDLVYRDPWGNPYLITMDLNYDGQCQDWFYARQKVSQYIPPPPASPGQQGYNGLINSSDPAGNSDNFRFHGTVMVWSMGPYGPATPRASSFDPTKPANDPANKNHILSWQ